jgi:hypothetical protein
MAWRLPGFLRGRSDAGAAHRLGLRAIRFRHLVRQYGRMLELIDDAAEKQAGEYILDAQYIVALIDRAFEVADAVAYDLNMLVDQRHVAFHEALEALHDRARALVAARSAAPPPEAPPDPGRERRNGSDDGHDPAKQTLGHAASGGDEPEYRLLAAVRRELFEPGGLAPGPGEDPDLHECSLRAVVQFAADAAGDALARQVRAAASSGGRLAARGTDVPPVAVTIVSQHDSGDSEKLAGAVDAASTGPGPLGEFLPAFLGGGPREIGRIDGAPGVEPASLRAIVSEEAAQIAVFQGEGFDLVNAYLSAAAASNHVYWRLAGSPTSGRMALASRILGRLGFLVATSAGGVTGWMPSRPMGETAARLRDVGRAVSYLRRAPSTRLGSSGIDGDVDRFFEVPGDEPGAETTAWNH